MATLKKKKAKSRKRAKDYGDKTPADYEIEKKRVRRLAKKAISHIDAMKKRSIALDRKFKHKEEPWDRGPK